MSTWRTIDQLNSLASLGKRTIFGGEVERGNHRSDLSSREWNLEIKFSKRIILEREKGGKEGTGYTDFSKDRLSRLEFLFISPSPPPLISLCVLRMANCSITLCLLQNRHRSHRGRSLLKAARVALPDKITYRANLVSLPPLPLRLSVPACRPVRSVCSYPCTRRCNLTGMGGSKRADRRVTSIPVSLLSHDPNFRNFSPRIRS